MSLEECSFRRTGFCVGLFNGGQHINLDLPWLVVVKQQSEGVEGCRCCGGLLILGAEPPTGRPMNIDRYMEERKRSFAGL